MNCSRWLIPILALLVTSATALAAEKSIILQSTTSTANSGLYDYLLPIFEGETGIQVNVVAVGTGQAIKNAQNCDGDVLLVHAKASEEEFVAEGYGTVRTELMYNDFIIVGPESDPAGAAHRSARATGVSRPRRTRRCDAGCHARGRPVRPVRGNRSGPSVAR